MRLRLALAAVAITAVPEGLDENRKTGTITCFCLILPVDCSGTDWQHIRIW